MDDTSSRCLKLPRRVDATTAAVFEDQCRALLEPSPPCLVVLDMGELDYISSAGLKVILFLAQSLRERRGEVRFAAMKSQVRELMDISGFMTLFQEFSTPDAAMNTPFDATQGDLPCSDSF